MGAGGRDRYLHYKMIPNFDKPAGFVASSPSAIAPERGYLPDPAQDAKSLTLFLQSSIAAYSSEQEKAEGLELGPEDLTFKLTRIGSKACEAFKMKIE